MSTLFLQVASFVMLAPLKMHAFIDASALASIVQTNPVPKKPSDIDVVTAYTKPDATTYNTTADTADAKVSDVKAARDDVIDHVNKNQVEITTNQSDLTTNQVQLGANQSTLSTNQRTMSDQSRIGTTNILAALEKLIQPNQMRDLLNGSKCQNPESCTADDKDFLSLLEDILNNKAAMPSTGGATAAMQAMLAALQSQSVVNAYTKDMVDTVNQTMSGAGNATGTDDFSVSNVVPTVKDPVQSTIDDFNQAIFPIVASDKNNPGIFTSAACTAVTSIQSDQQKFLCNMLINSMYAGTLVKSCKDDWSTANPSGAGNQSGVASSATASSTSSNTSPKFTKSSYPDGVDGCTSEKYTDAANASWNGWTDTVSSLAGVGTSSSASGTGQDSKGIVPFCNAVIANISTIYDSSQPQYESLATQVQSNCQDLIDALKDNASYKYSANFQDIGTSGKPMLIDALGKIPQLTKNLQKFLSWQMYAYYSNPQVSGLKQGYPSMWTLLGYDDLNSSEANSTNSSTTASSSSTAANTNQAATINGDSLSDIVNNCVSGLTRDLTNSTVAVSYPTQTNSAKLAQLYLANISDQLPTTTFIPIPTFASAVSAESGAAAIVTSNGRFYAFGNDGKALSNSTDAATTVQIDASTGVDINTVISNQSAASAAVSAFATTYQDQMQRLLTQRLLTASAMQQLYTDRTIKVNYSGTSRCSLTPAQIQRYNAVWRIDPTVQICATSSDGTQDCSKKGTWIEQIATSTSNELVPEINLLLSELINQNYTLSQQNQTLILLQALTSGGVIQDNITKLGNTAMSVKNMINAYNTGASIASASPIPAG